MTGCGRYADFSLPAPPPSQAQVNSFDWKAEPSPVLSNAGAVDVLNPSVVLRNGVYYNLYSAYDGKAWHTDLAISSDGIEWRNQGRVLSPQPDTWEGSYIAANGSALFDGGEFSYWYVAGPRDKPSIGVARSTDGKAWRKNPAPVVEPGPRGSWDERGVADPAVIRIGDTLYMYYLGQDRARRQRLGLARSVDGVRWQKLRANPVLEGGPDGAFDERLGEPAVWQSHGSYWMIYTGRDAHEYRRLGLARSIDGVAWTKLPGSFAGAERWNEKVLCDPTVLVERDFIRVWFGGGDMASPDENLHGQIGIAKLVPRL
jgi:predicted GH43/DUF377 family glycosyl hydrolase